MKTSGMFFTFSVFFMLCLAGMAAAQPSAEILPSTQEVGQGSSFDISIFLDTDGHKLVAGRVQYLTFDPTVLETSTGDIVPGDLLVVPIVSFKTVNNTAGTIWVDAADQEWQTQTPPGNYVTVTFTAKDTAAPGTYPISITWMRFMDEGANVWVTPDIAITNGSVIIRDNAPPTYSNVTASPSSPATYAPGQNYTFSITIEDNVAVDTVVLEFDGVNYTNFAQVGSVYSYQFTGLAVGSYTYRWYMNDTSGNSNSTPAMSYVINIASPYPWDVNDDGVVDDLDLGLVILHYSEETEPPYPPWDVNQDGIVDDMDLGLVILHYGEDYR
jgi:hypothetical protein